MGHFQQILLFPFSHSSLTSRHPRRFNHVKNEVCHSHRGKRILARPRNIPFPSSKFPIVCKSIYILIHASLNYKLNATFITSPLPTPSIFDPNRYFESIYIYMCISTVFQWAIHNTNESIPTLRLEGFINLVSIFIWKKRPQLQIHSYKIIFSFRSKNSIQFVGTIGTNGSSSAKI